MNQKHIVQCNQCSLILKQTTRMKQFFVVNQKHIEQPV